MFRLFESPALSNAANAYRLSHLMMLVRTFLLASLLLPSLSGLAVWPSDTTRRCFRHLLSSPPADAANKYPQEPWSLKVTSVPHTSIFPARREWRLHSYNRNVGAEEKNAVVDEHGKRLCNSTSIDIDATTLILEHQKGASPLLQSYWTNQNAFLTRRTLVSSGAAILTAHTLCCGSSQQQQRADAALFQPAAKSLYVVSPRVRNTTSSAAIPVNANGYSKSELCLLKLLPIRSDRKVVFRSLQARLEGITAALKGSPEGWDRVTANMQEAVSFLDKRRDQLAPVFNQEDGTLLAISKAEQGELRIEALRAVLVDIERASREDVNATLVFQKQRQGLLTLAEVGELLVATFPYDVPSEGKFSYLPRLLGRARVTFSFKRRGTVLGNVTILADGYTAPMTAGNFVDLAQRNFYTGLPVKFQKKRLQEGNEFDVANIPILGSYEQGFYDPLTAKLRRIPLEIIRVEKSNGVAALSYSSQGLPSLTPTKSFLNLDYNNFPGFSIDASTTPEASLPLRKQLKPKVNNGSGGNNGSNNKDGGTSSSISPSTVVLEPTSFSKPLLSFDIQGLVAMNHPDKNPNGASSEFFCLQSSSMIDSRRDWLDGDYAPFGYIISGMNVLEQLQAGDVIESTTVDEWGNLNLVKLRRSSFSEVVQGADTGEKEEESIE